jgi:FkbM family methyltransferase
MYANKIETNNYGLGNDDKDVECEYSKEWKGHAGIYPLPNNLRHSSSIEKEIIHLANAEKILNQIITENPSYDIAIKMDCEGSEIEILEKLCNSRYFNTVIIIMLEWHRRGGRTIVEKLLPLGFKTVMLNSSNSNVGMIYAIR